jgi:hypothetical protein
MVFPFSLLPGARNSGPSPCLGEAGPSDLQCVFSSYCAAFLRCTREWPGPWVCLPCTGGIKYMLFTPACHGVDAVWGCLPCVHMVECNLHCEILKKWYFNPTMLFRGGVFRIKKSHQGGAPMIEHWWLNKKGRETRTHTHTHMHTRALSFCGYPALP